ncbi:hypothetical protein CO662_27760 [Rhizobium anhuiense]|uniref:Uncharacterized protein n=1 Tax=Rhizobium anhuiense TaxID=1184720 RepID=A0A3S0Q778_9HYPH|nr:hypothetical protein [Rhizobium anhuiense]PDS41736.1 hypothetical protein CO668_27645 [Rhizobium anhuiense]PDS48846.1 hypothetical protein CO662_27760 [Rhizobium anhuiense]RUL98995.1 hypothetical protein EEQ99_23035 [Rhizobium anhuiense]
MKEVRSVLHAIFRCLLKRLDETELRCRGSLRQGKTCLLIHISDFADRFRLALWTMGRRSISGKLVHSLSTATKKITHSEGLGIIFRFSFSPNLGNNGEILPMFFAGARQMASAVDGF